MSDSAEDIRNQMQRLRQSATGEVREIVDSAKTLTDWRYHVKHHPWACMGAAVVLGFLVVPRKRHVPSAEAKELAELLKKYDVGVAAAPQSSKQGMFKSMIGAAIPIIARQALGVAQQRFAEHGGLSSFLGGLSGRRAEPEFPEYEDHRQPR